MKYVASGTDCPREEVFIPASLQTGTSQADSSEAVTIKILSPAFYTRFVQYAHPSELIDNELLAGEEEERTFWVSDLEVTSQLFGKTKKIESAKKPSEHLRGLDRARWAILKNLRTSPKNHSQNTSSKSTVHPTARATDIRTMPLSPLDKFVISHCTSADVRQYGRVVSKLLLSDLIAFGLPNILDLGDLLIRLVLCNLAVYDIRETFKSNFRSAISLSDHLLSIPAELALLVCSYNSLHIWALIRYFL